MLNKRVLTTIIGVASLVSCSSIQESRTTSEERLVRFVETQESITYSIDDENPLRHFSKENFKINNFDYIYKGEEIKINQPLTTRVSIVKVYAKNPEYIVSKDSENFSKLPNESNEKVLIEDLDSGDKKVTRLDRNYLYAEIKDNRTGKTRDILLEKNVKVIDAEFMQKDGVSYEELKKGRRVKYEINTIEKAYDDIIPESDPEDNLYDPYGQGYEAAENYPSFNNGDDEEEGDEDDEFDYDEANDNISEVLEKKIDYSKIFTPDKYLDEDDYIGYKRVSVRQKINGTEDISKNILVKFGKSIQDYKDNYSSLLIDLENKSLKFDNEGNVVGGFNPDLVSKIEQFHKKSPKDGTVKFETEILDKDKDTVGLHNVVRRIKLNDKVIFEKKDKVFVSFPGINIAVADGNFFDLSDEVEARTYRYTAKDLDDKVDFIKVATTERELKDANRGLTRTHGATVIGSMIDEISAGDRYYWYGSLLSYLANLGTKETSEFPNFIKNRKELNTVIGNVLSNIELKYGDEKKSPIKKLIIDAPEGESSGLIDVIRTLVSKANEAIEEYDTLPVLENKIKLDRAYSNLKTAVDTLVYLPETDKLSTTDLHFTTITSGIGRENIDRNIVSKNLSNLLDLNKNIKVLNASYGSALDLAEYYRLKDMSKETKLKVLKEYNENPLYRQAVLGYLKSVKDLETRGIVDYKGHLSIPSVYNYFETRETITLEDLQKIIDLKILSLENSFSTSPELTALNHDILIVKSNGNTDNSADIDLTEFDENGNKIIYKDINYIYNNPFSTLPVAINNLEKKYADENGKDYTYNYAYRKNMLMSVGLAPKLILAGTNATENISNQWGLFTFDFNLYKYKAYGTGMLSVYEDLVSKIEDATLNPDKYTSKYLEDLKLRLKVLNAYIEEKSKETSLFSFKRAGAAKLWTMAADGTYVYTKKLSDEEKKYNTEEDGDYGYAVEIGSSFSSPRMAAVAAKVGNIYPWMSAHDIKTTLLTTAIDDFRVEYKEDGSEVQIGIYGPDENIGWGIMDKNAALGGPARFVKALTHEAGLEDFVANIPYGTYSFDNDISGALDPVAHAQTRGYIKYKEAVAIYNTAKYKDRDLLDENFFEPNKGKEEKDLTDEEKELAKERQELKKTLDRLNISVNDIVENIRPKLAKYIPSLPFEERELFKSAGLIKDGKGTLILKGNNTYESKTTVLDGSLILLGALQSDVDVEKEAKLKLDSLYIERLNLARILAGRSPIAGGIKGKVINKGELYSYSRRDSIQNMYTPYEGSRTRVAGIGTLTVDKLDLSNIDSFDIEIFRKKGMSILPIPENKPASEYSNSDIVLEREVGNEDYNKRMLFYAKKIKAADINKLNLEEKSISSSLKLVYELTPIISKLKNENDEDFEKRKKLPSEEYELKIYVERKNPINFSYERPTVEFDKEQAKKAEAERKAEEEKKAKEEKEVTDAAARENGDIKPNIKPSNTPTVNTLRAHVIERLNAGEIDIVEAQNLNENLDFLDEEKEETLKGEVLSNSLLVSIDLHDIKVRTLNDVLNEDKTNKFNSVFATTLVDFRTRNEGNKNITTSIGSLIGGVTFNTKYTRTGIAFDYGTSKLNDVELLVNSKSTDAKNEYKLGEVRIHNLGTSIFNKVEYKGAYLNTILSLQYNLKNASREIEDREVTNTESSDLILNMSNQLGYKYELNLGDVKLKLNPYIGLNAFRYIVGSFNENDGYGYKGDSQGFNKVNTVLGMKLGVDLYNKGEISIFADYTKYLTKTEIKTEAELKGYKFLTDIKGIKLDDHLVHFGLEGKVKVNEALSINASYINRNIKSNILKLGINYEF